MNYQKFYTNQIHSSSLLCQLAQMWKTQVLCDAMIKTGSVTTKAHRVVLVAACPMLQSMDNATSGSHLEVRLAAEIKQDSINTFLQYLYEGFMMLTEDNVRDVEKIARLLQVDSIIKCCADFHKCLQSKTGAPSPQYKYGFHDMIEFRHVRSSDLQKTVQERMMKRPSEMSRPGSPGSKRHRSNRPSSPSSDASGSGDMSQSAPAPWDRVPQLGSGISSHSSSWPSQVGRSQPEPGVIEIIEDSLELVQTVGPDKDSGPGGTRLDPRAVQKSVAISVASQMNTETDLRVVDVPSDISDTRTTYQTSSGPSTQAQGPGSSHSRSFSHSSSASSSKESKFSDKSFSGMSSRDEPKKQRPDIPIQSFSSDNLHARAIQQHRASNESHSTPQKMPFPVSISPIGSGKSFAAGSAEQVSSASDLPSVRSPVTAYRPQASPASHHSPMTPPSMSPSSVKSQSMPSMRRPSDMGRPDTMDDSSSEKGQDHRKDSNMPQSSTADMTPDLSIVKVETKQGTSYSANTETGGLDMYVDMPEQEQPDDDEGNIDYEEPSGDWSHEDDGSNISGDQSSSWYSGSYQGFQLIPKHKTGEGFYKQKSEMDPDSGAADDTKVEDESDPNMKELYDPVARDVSEVEFLYRQHGANVPFLFGSHGVKFPLSPGERAKHVIVRNEGNKYRLCSLCQMNQIKTKSGHRPNTYFKCQACDIPLCTGQRGCFEKYHNYLFSQ